MAANKSQGSFLAVFLAGATTLCAGAFFFSSGTGKLLLVVGAVLIVLSLMGTYKIKSLEGKTAVLPGSEGMKWVGACVVLLGWVLTLVGLHLFPSTGGRMVMALVGIAVSLFGIIKVLPATLNRNAFWKTKSNTEHTR